MNSRRFSIAVKSAGPFVGLLFLAILTASASPELPPGVGATPLVQVARVVAPEGPELGLLNRAIPAEPLPLTARPVDEARRDAASKTFEEFSGGSAGTLLIGGALVAAVTLLLAVVLPWLISIESRT